jgi:CRP-like cAMP-binding protein
MSGRVQAIKNYGEDSELVLGELSRGDIIGDMALITEEPRSATIKSTKLTRLICFSKDTFNSVMYSNPQALMEVSKALINRLKHKESRDDGQSLVIGVISLIDKVSTDRFLDLFISSLNRHGSIESVDEKISGTGQDLFNFEILIENIIAEKNYLVQRSRQYGVEVKNSKLLR